MPSFEISNCTIESHFVLIPAGTKKNNRCTIILESLCKEFKLNIDILLNRKLLQSSIQRCIQSHIKFKKNDSKLDEYENWKKATCCVLSTGEVGGVEEGDQVELEQQPHAGGRPKKRLRYQVLFIHDIYIS